MNLSLTSRRAILVAVPLLGIGIALANSPARRRPAVPGARVETSAPHPPRARSLPPLPPDQWKLAFVRGSDIWTASGDGTGQRRIIRNGDVPCWSPDHRRLAFARAGNVWIASADGTGERQLTFRWKDVPPTLARREIDIAWTPNRDDRILFSHPDTFQVTQAGEREADTQEWSRLFSVSPDAGERDGESPRSRSGRTSDEDHPACSRTGKYIAFTRSGDIWLTGRLEKTGPEEWAAWNAFTERLASVALDYSQEFGASDCYVFEPTRLCWSPDEKLLAYSFERLNGSSNHEIHLLRLAGTGMDTLRVVRNTVLDEDGSEPCFSPDGKTILFTDCDPRGSRGIASISVTGRHRRILIPDASEPAW